MSTSDRLSPLLEAWTRGTGFALRTRQRGHTGRDGATADLQRLMAAHDADSARKLLASAKGPARSAIAGESGLDVPRLVDFLIALCVTALGSPERVERAKALAGWLSLVAEFSDAHDLHAAHALFLEGAADAFTGRRQSGIKTLETALERYGNVRDTVGVRSATAALLGHLEGGTDAPAEARRHLEQAAALASELPASERAWGTFLSRLREQWEERWRIVDRLGSDAPVDFDVRGLAADEDLLALMEARTIRRAAKGETAAALATGKAAEAVASLLGMERRFLESVGTTALQAGAIDMAESIARAVAAWHPTQPERRLLLLKVLAKQGKTEEVETEASSILRAAPDLTEAHFELGLALMHQRRLDEALSALGRARELSPDDPNVLHCLALLSPEQLPGVRFTAETGALEIDPNLMRQAPQELPFLISAAIVRSQPAQAATKLKAIEQESGREFADRVRAYLFPSVPAQGGATHFDRAEALFAAHKPTEARAEYLLAIADEPENSFAYMGLGDCYYQEGKYNLATAYFEESLAIAPHPSTYRFLGNAHERCGRKSRALEAYRAALKLKPDYAMARAQIERLEQSAEGDDG